MQELVKTGKSPQINKQSDVIFWIYLREFGSVLYTFSCIVVFSDWKQEIQLSKITENVQVVNFSCNSKTGSTLKLQEAYAGN